MLMDGEHEEDGVWILGPKSQYCYEVSLRFEPDLFWLQNPYAALTGPHTIASQPVKVICIIYGKSPQTCLYHSNRLA